MNHWSGKGLERGGCGASREERSERKGSGPPEWTVEVKRDRRERGPNRWSRERLVGEGAKDEWFCGWYKDQREEKKIWIHYRSSSDLGG